MGKIVIFGASGFVGTHLVRFLCTKNSRQELVLVDASEPSFEKYGPAVAEAIEAGCISFRKIDLRGDIPLDLCEGSVDIIFNLAAVHREPGHSHEEYFETNICSARNICNWAQEKECFRIVFVSSISVYGQSETPKCETSIPCPRTAYGMSKYIAENIHMTWQASESPRRKILIVRPGVVFGAGEQGNITRLVRSLLHGYFFYFNNHKVKKSAIYVKELCYILDFGLAELDKSQDCFLLLNASMNPIPTLQDFVEVISSVLNIRPALLNIPMKIAIIISHLINNIARLMKIAQPIHPTRIHKLCHSTNVEAQNIHLKSYHYHYTLESAFRDWLIDSPDVFLKKPDA